MKAIQYLSAIRAFLNHHQLQACIVPSADAHLSEYLPAHWQARAEFSGFTGSVGTLVVTPDEAGVWVDSRYWEQAEQQLANTGIQLQKLTAQSANHVDWLLANLPENATVWVASDMLSWQAQQALTTAFASKNIQLTHQADLINTVWQNRPPLPKQAIYAHQAEFVSQSASDKLASVRQIMAEQGADYHLICALDDIAWLTNLRGNDVEYNPVFLAHVLMSQNQATLFVDEDKLSDPIRTLLAQAQIAVAGYEQIATALSQISGKLLLDSSKVSVGVLRQLPPSVAIVDRINPSTLLKSIKNEQDLQHIRQAHIADGVALCGFFAELQDKLNASETISELDIHPLIVKHRSKQAHFVSPSFGTIAGFNANGALPHYSATEEHFSNIEGDGLLLIDSGGQYQNGTTDITRVIAIGTPTSEQIRDFTLVLKAHIALAMAVFPENIPAPLLDSICRLPLWQAQCDFGHGTGHGVGYFLNVHEGPQVIAYQAKPIGDKHAMKAGMVTSNEPGLYRPNKWGIRIENLVANVAVQSPQESEFGRFLRFETLSLCPIDGRLIDGAMLNVAERDWLNDYHATVRTRLLPHVEGRAKDWLIESTQAI